MANYKFITDAKRRRRDKRSKAFTGLLGNLGRQALGIGKPTDVIDAGIDSYNYASSFAADRELIEEIITAVNMGEITVPELIQLRKLTKDVDTKRAIRAALNKLGVGKRG